MARLVPIEDEPDASMFGYMRGTVTITGDIIDAPRYAWSAGSGDEDHLYADLKIGEGD